MSEKDRYLASAQKFLQKGQLDRAIKDYEQAVTLDPKDTRCRQRLAELLVKANRKDDAVREFETIGKYYADNGYFLKAIAVYKQIQKLDPQNMEITLALGDLNEKQGLKGNALAEYRAAVEFHERAGNLLEAGKALDRMLLVDQGNISIKVKKGDLLLSGHLPEAAYVEYVAAAVMAREGREIVAFRDVSDRVRTRLPARREFISDVAEALLEGSNPDEALSLLLECAVPDRSIRDWKLLVRAYSGAGDWSQGIETAASAVRKFPDEIPVREALLDVYLGSGDYDRAIETAERCRADFPSTRWEELEGLYKKILENVPTDRRVLENLRGLYAAAGKGAKAEEVALRISLLDKGGSPPPVFPTEAGERQPSAPPVSASPVTAPRADSAEEIGLDLSLSEEPLPSLVSGAAEGPAGPSEPVSEALQVAVPAGAGGGVEIDFADSDMELDLGDALDMDLPDPSEFEADFSAESPVPEATPEPEAPEIELPTESGGEELAEEEEDFAFLDLDLDLDLGSGELPGEEPVEEVGAVSEPELTVDAVLAEIGPVPPTRGEEDPETHYNLGIAYKEMGLYDDALAEFSASARSPERRIDSLTLLGICRLEQGDLDGAARIYSAAIRLEGATPEEKAIFHYELGLVYEQEGREDESRSEFVRVQELSPGFRDVALRLAPRDGEGSDLAELELVEDGLDSLE